MIILLYTYKSILQHVKNIHLIYKLYFQPYTSNATQSFNIDTNKQTNTATATATATAII